MDPNAKKKEIHLLFMVRKKEKKEEKKRKKRDFSLHV